jgi:hypothetical protein
MSTVPTPEELAETLVVVGPACAGGGWCIHLVPPGGGSPVYVAPHMNPSVVRDEAKRVRGFVAAVIQQARESAAAPPDKPMPP